MYVILHVTALFSSDIDLALDGLSRMLLPTTLYIVVINLTCQDCVIMCRANYYVHVLAVTSRCVCIYVYYLLLFSVRSIFCCNN